MCAIGLSLNSYYTPGLKHNRYRCDIGCIEVVEDFEQMRNHLKSSNDYSMRLKRTYVWNYSLNALGCKGNYSATSNNMKLVHWSLMGGLLHLKQRGGDWAGPHPVKAPLLAVPNETIHPTTDSVGLPNCKPSYSQLF